MLKFLKATVVGTKEGRSMIDIKCDEAANWINSTSLDVGLGTNKALAFINKEEEKKKVRCAMRSCLVAMVSYLQGRLPLDNPVLRDLQCLDPVVRKTQEGKSALARLCMHLRKVTRTDDICDKVYGEWLLYMCESDISVGQWSTDQPQEGMDICSYWNRGTELCDGLGEKKYANLGVIVKSQSYVASKFNTSLLQRIKNSVLVVKMSLKMSLNFKFLVSLNFDFWSGRPAY